MFLGVWSSGTNRVCFHFEKVYHYWNNDRITYHEVEVEIPDNARIQWYLEGEGNIYYVPELIVGKEDTQYEFKRIWMNKRGPV